VFLTWTVHNGPPLRSLTQAHLDLWAATQPSHQRQGAHGLLTWAMKHRHLPHLVVARPRFQSGAAITQKRRLHLIRRYTTDEAIALSSRVVICLMLLYAQPVSRVLRLTNDDITTSQDGQVNIVFGDPPMPVPEPFAELLRHLIANRDYPNSASIGSRWLFPGIVADQPLAYSTMIKRLRRLDFPIREARVSSLRQVVLQAPAPIVADALGFHQTTTARQLINAGVTWSRYAASDRHRQH
jgi:integrase